MMRAMLKPDFSAASLPGDNPGANARAWKLYRQVSERTGELARKGGKGEAQAFLRQIQDSGQFQQDQIIQLKWFHSESWRNWKIPGSSSRTG